MLKKLFIFFITVHIIFVAGEIWSQNTFSVENAIFLLGSTDNILTISLNVDSYVAAIQFDLSYDSNCFIIDPQSLTRTDRTVDLTVFQASNPEPGLIMFAGTGIGTT
ncbi:MAG: hypothetical protein JSV84_04115, partial [Gemmatimonadota bacterium]